MPKPPLDKTPFQTAQTARITQENKFATDYDRAGTKTWALDLKDRMAE
jgi:hypothetical protein